MQSLSEKRITSLSERKRYALKEQRHPPNEKRLQPLNCFLWLMCVLALVSFLLLASQTEVAFNQSPSLKHRVFLTVKGMEFSRGDLVTVLNHPTAYYPEVRFTKRVVGLPRDWIQRKGDELSVNGTLCAMLLHETAKGQPLTPLNSQAIPDGYVLVLGDHPRSFDSRYQEFGLVPISRILGRTFGLW
jgi:conjugal transfer pilin signal peptidase TrbI